MFQKKMSTPGWHMATGLVLTFIFSIFIWEPAWDHYHIQYLPYLSVAAGYALYELLQRLHSRKGFETTILVTGLVLLFYIGLSLPLKRYSAEAYQGMKEIKKHTSSVFSFNPLVSIVAGVEPACGLIDPFNVYGKRSLSYRIKSAYIEKFKVTDQDLFNCIRQHPGIRLYISKWFLFFIDESWVNFLKGLPESRFIYSNSRVQKYFELLLNK